ncbi:hypothetical protein H1R20_g14947, partial [Candolleomyces eurysporus]
MLVKHWIMKYSWDVGTSVLTPKQSLALRQLRFKLFHTWHIPSVIDYLPLQLVLAHFFILITIIPAWRPLTSPQAWLPYRILSSIYQRLIPNAGGRKIVSGGWVDHGIEAVQSQQTAQFEIEGLLSVQCSLGMWHPGLIRNVFACALSLPDTIRYQALCVLFIQYIPLSIFESDDPQDGFNFASKLGAALEQDLFVEAYAALCVHLSTFLDSEKPLPNPVAPDVLENGMLVLLVLVCHPWVQHKNDSTKSGKKGWSLLFAMLTSSNFFQFSPDRQGIIAKKILNTFLDIVLHHRDSHNDWSQRSLSVLPYIQLPPQWRIAAFQISTRAEEHLWVLSMACNLLVFLARRVSDFHIDEHFNTIFNCWEHMKRYLEAQLENGSKTADMERAVKLWTHALSHRRFEQSGEFGMSVPAQLGEFNMSTSMQLFKHRHRVDGFHLKLCELLDVIDQAVTATSTLEDLKIVLWRLRIFNASNSLDVLKLFNEVVEFSDHSLAERDSLLLSSRLSGFTKQELHGICKLLIFSLLVDEITPAPWQTNHLDANYQRIVLAYLILRI